MICSVRKTKYIFPIVERKYTVTARMLKKFGDRVSSKQNQGTNTEIELSI